MFYAAIFRCRKCDSQSKTKQRFYGYITGQAKCPKCLREDVRRQRIPDGIDRIVKSPLSVLQGLMGGHLYHCVYCRIQFYDLRARERDRSPAS
jgi:phage FluMu protein Com